MPEDFKKLSIEVAAQDSDLTAFLELEMFGATFSVSPDREELIENLDEQGVRQLRADIKRSYGLGEPEFNRALGACAAKVIENHSGVTIKTVREFFDDKTGLI